MNEIKVIIPCENTKEEIKKVAIQQGLSFNDNFQTNFDGELLCQITTIAIMPLIGFFQLLLQIVAMRREKVSIEYNGRVYHNIPIEKAIDFIKQLEKSDTEN